MKYSILSWTLFILFQNGSVITLAGFSSEVECSYKNADLFKKFTYDKRYEKLKGVEQDMCMEIK